MFDDYDDKQRFYRYKHGHHAFVLTIVLLFVNGLLDLQWGETVHIETMLLLLTAFLYFTVMNVYYGAHFRKNDKPLWSNISFFILALFYIGQVLSRDDEMISNGKVSFKAVTLAIGICFLSIPLMYSIRIMVEKIKSKKSA